MQRRYNEDLEEHQLEGSLGDGPSFTAVGRMQSRNTSDVTRSTFRGTPSQTISPPLPSAFKQLDSLSRPRASLINESSKGKRKPQTDVIKADLYINSLFSSDNEISKSPPTNYKESTLSKSRVHSSPQDFTTSSASISPFDNSSSAYGVRKTNSGGKLAETSAHEKTSAGRRSPSRELKGGAAAKTPTVSSASFVNAISRVLASVFSKSPVRITKKNDSYDGSASNSDWMSFLNDKPNSDVALPLASSSDCTNSSRVRQQQQKRKQGTGAMLLLILFLIFYIITQASMGVGVERKAAADMRKRNQVNAEYIAKGARLHEEGMDRPNSVEYLRMVHQQRMGPQRVVGGVERDVRKPLYDATEQQHSMTGLGALAIPQGDSALREQLLQRLRTEEISSTLKGRQPNQQSMNELPQQDAAPQMYQPPNPNLLSPQNKPDQFDAAAPLPAYSNIANVDTRLIKGTETPVFWHIPKAGGGSFKEIMGQCMGLTLGCELGGDPSHAADTELQVFEIGGKRVVNVDTYKPIGIEKAKKLNLGSSGLAHVIVSPYLHQVSTLFSPHHRGRFFAVFRDPIDRAVSTYWFLEQVFAKQNPNKSFMTIEEYAKSSKIENNWMTRFATNRLAGPLAPDDLQLAKHMLKAKCIVGLIDKKEESLQRFNKYFEWNYLNENVEKGYADARQQCIQHYLIEAPSHRKFSRQIVERGSATFALLVAQNVFDLELYLYAKELFGMQTSLFE